MSAYPSQMHPHRSHTGAAAVRKTKRSTLDGSRCLKGDIRGNSNIILTTSSSPLLEHCKYACAFTDRIVAESHDTDEWYEYSEDVASLLDHPKSLVRNRALYILAANAQWDEENRFDLILPDYLKHITDEKPITARQCVKALAQVGLARPQYIPQILSALRSADLSKYKDSMRPLIERDMEETEKILMNSGLLR